ncbi:MAG: hypothetical protein HZC54_10215 [Verrucomicrobia bacterium]|nr:hypothetical protein [Verrucomicrobiota bacterium]
MRRRVSDGCRIAPLIGPVKPNAFHLCLGNYKVVHPAHFNGLLDEVRLYNRALSPEELRQCVRALRGYQ